MEKFEETQKYTSSVADVSDVIDYYAKMNIFIELQRSRDEYSEEWISYVHWKENYVWNTKEVGKYKIWGLGFYYAVEFAEDLLLQ